MESPNNIFSNFTNLYQLQKTLRFELKPVPRDGETPKEALNRLKSSAFFINDSRRENAYAEVKTIIDDFFRDFIDTSLKNVKINWTPLAEALDSKDEKTWQQLSDSIRKEIVKAFGDTKEILGKALFEKIIPTWLSTKANTQKITGEAIARKRELLAEFKGFTTYFSGFWENRKNLFSDKEKHTAIAFRIVHENFPRFYGNIKAFKNAPQEIQEEFSGRFPVALDAFNNTLTQSGIDSYNSYIGGGCSAQSGEEKERGFNERISQWNQTHKEKKAPKMKLLYKQILSDRESTWSGRFILDKQDLTERLKKLYENIFERKNVSGETAIEAASELFTNLTKFDFSKIWLAEKSVPALALSLFGQWDALNSELKISGGDSDSKAKKERLFSLQEIEKAIKSVREHYESIEENPTLPSLHDFITTIKHSSNLGINFASISEVTQIAQKELKAAIQISEQTDELLGDDAKITGIKSALDRVMDIFHKLKTFRIREKNLQEKETDAAFYAEFENVFSSFSSCASVYDSVRNYLTKKPYSTEKMKLCFDIQKLGGGWVDSYTEKSFNGTQHGAYIFRKRNHIGEYDYFLGISKNSKLFSSRNKVSLDDISDYERFDYYQPKETSIYGASYCGGEFPYRKEKEALIELTQKFSEKNGYQIKNRPNKEVTPNQCLQSLKTDRIDIFEKLIVNPQFKIINERIINNLKNTLRTYERVPKLQSLANRHFDLFLDLMNAISLRMKEKSFRFFPVSKSEFSQAINDTSDKPFYLFKIQSKDLSFAESYKKNLRKSRGNDNLHTLYFKTLFQERQTSLDIGTGEVFFRKASIKLSEKKKQNGHHYNELKDKFSYPIISNRRYTEDKILFHLSVNLNYTANAKASGLEERVKEKAKRGEFTHVIGLDRGERNLVSYSLIDINGKIVEQGSFNVIQSGHGKTTHNFNYQELLKNRETERQEARKSWKTIGKIAELKEGYISQVVHAISKLIVKHNAIVVLEDLNIGFKRGRFKVERQVYQKFERALIEKLNFLVFKDRKDEEPGGVLNAFQLTNKFESFEKLGNQSGILFYVPAGYTSKIDPKTGFVNIFDLSNITNAKAKKEFFSKFSHIYYSEKDDAFAFEFDYSNFKTYKQPIAKTIWTIYSHGTRLVWNPKEKRTETETLTAKLKEAFEFAKIDWRTSANLVPAICEVSEEGDFRTRFWDQIFRAFKYTLQMRNSIPGQTGSDADYLISPVKGEDGTFFDSRTEAKKDEPTLPTDADNNGAYHIALKGLMGIHRKFAVGWQKNDSWFKFVQNREFEK